MELLLSDVLISSPSGIVSEAPLIAFCIGELSGCGFIQDHNSVFMELERSCGDHAGEGTFHCFCNDGGFFIAGSDEKKFFGFEDGADAHCDGAHGHIFGLIEEGAVLFKRCFGEGDSPGAGCERGEGFVESDMTGSADPEELQIDTAAEEGTS